MLDDNLSDAIAQQGFHNDDSEYLLDSQETLFDDHLDLDDNVFEDIGLMDNQCSTDLGNDKAFDVDDQILDEDLFWAELDVGATDQDMEETPFEDILGSDEFMNGDDSRARPRAADTGGMHNDTPENGSIVSHIESRLSQPANADCFRGEPSGVPIKEASHGLNDVLSGDINTANDNGLPHDSLGERPFDDIGEILNWSADKILGQMYCDDEMLDATATPNQQYFGP